MKKLIVLISILVMVPWNASADLFSTEDGCRQVAEIANIIMTARQGGVPMKVIVSAGEGRSAGERVLLIGMASIAYNQPKYSTESYQQNAIIEFENLWYNRCMMKVLEKQKKTE